MLVREWEGKSLLAGGGITVPKGTLVSAPGEADDVTLRFPVAVKAQVGAGGRGKAGGIVKATDAAELRAAVARLLDGDLGGERPTAVLVEEWQATARELYLSVTVDGNADGYTVLYSPAGGVDVETCGIPVRYDVGRPEAYRGHGLRRRLAEAEPDAGLRERIIALARRLLWLARHRDCQTIEINPLIVTEDGALVAADAKVVRDTAGAFRAADIRSAVENAWAGEDPLSARCLAAELMLVRLEGEVGLISGGAGMTMAVMDMIAAAGARPACFLDCSANPTPTGYRLAFALLDQAPEVRAILVSIFGGATQMERVARVMADILAERDSAKPVVFRLNGTNAGEASRIMAAAGLVNHGTLEEAVAAVVVAAAGGAP